MCPNDWLFPPFSWELVSIWTLSKASQWFPQENQEYYQNEEINNWHNSWHMLFQEERAIFKEVVPFLRLSKDWQREVLYFHFNLWWWAQNHQQWRTSKHFIEIFWPNRLQKSWLNYFQTSCWEAILSLLWPWMHLL